MIPYSYYSPILKQAAITVGDTLATLSPTNSALANYAIYSGGGGLAGAGIGALVNALRGESKLKGALIGGGIGLGAGAGIKALGDYTLSGEKALIEAFKNRRERDFLTKLYEDNILYPGTLTSELLGLDRIPEELIKGETLLSNLGRTLGTRSTPSYNTSF
jgi:hypothetical protein